MADTDITATTTTSLNTTSIEYQVSQALLEDAQSEEYYYYNSNFPKYLGYYKTIPELKKAIDALAIWATGKGYEADNSTRIEMENLIGNGKDNDDTLLWNLFVMKKINGDSFAQVIRGDDGKIINLKPLNPLRVRIVFDKMGMLKRYDYFQLNNSWKPLDKENVLHLINDKIGDEVHGTSVIEACKWVIDARNEAMVDKRRILHRSTIRIIEVDMDDGSTKLDNLKSDYKDAVKKGEVLFIPKGSAAVPNVSPLSTVEHLAWTQYLENFFYQAVGIPRVIATSENFTEASSKVGYMTFEPIYTREQQVLEKELWNQLAIKVKFNRPPSLMDNMKTEQQKNVGQTRFQPNDVIGGTGE